MITKTAATTMATAIGPFTMIAGDDGVLAAGFVGSAAELSERIAGCVDPAGVGQRNELGEFSRAAGRYFAGDLDAIDGIPVAQVGSPFLHAAWAALRSIPAGHTLSYRELAARTPCASPRAAGSACARNAVTLFIPCHRVVRSGGELGGYLWGLDRKRWLLDHEQRHSLAV